MHPWVRHQVHSDFIQVHIKITFETHRASEVVHYMGDDGVLLLIVPYFLSLATDVKD